MGREESQICRVEMAGMGVKSVPARGVKAMKGRRVGILWASEEIVVDFVSDIARPVMADVGPTAEAT